MTEQLSEIDVEFGIHYSVLKDPSEVIFRSDRDAFGRKWPIFGDNSTLFVKPLPKGKIAVISLDSPDEEFTIALKLAQLAEQYGYPYTAPFHLDGVYPRLYTFFDDDGFVIAFKTVVVIPDKENPDFWKEILVVSEPWVHPSYRHRNIAALLNFVVDGWYSTLAP